jgi:hypothetical protein
LLYLGKTVRHDPYKYVGSGLYWRRHIAVHGKEIDTLWVELFHDKDLLIELADFMSKFFAIAHDDKWANLVEENGLDGGQIITDETRNKMAAAKLGKTLSAETKQRMSRSQLNRKRDSNIGQKISASKKGKSFSEKHKAALKAASNKTKSPLSQSTREKISASRKLTEARKKQLINNEQT